MLIVIFSVPGTVFGMEGRLRNLFRVGLMEHGDWVAKDNRINKDETRVAFERLKVMVPLHK